VVANSSLAGPPNVLAHYPLDGNADDESGNGHGGTIVGTVTPDTDRYGNASGAMRFNGTGYIDVGTGLKVPFPITVAAWVKLDQSGVHEIFKNDRQTGDDWYHGVGVAVANGTVHAFVGSGFASPSTRKTKTTNEAVVPTGEWCHIAVVFHEHNNIQLYVDGVERPGTYGGNGTGMTYSSTYHGDIGRGEPSGSGDQVFGKIDDLWLFNAALTSAQVHALISPFGYTSGVDPLVVPGSDVIAKLVAYPNPFNPAVSIKFDMAADELVNASVYDISGRRVAVVFNGPGHAGMNKITWSGTDDRGRRLGSGTYLCAVRAGGSTKSIRLQLVK